MSSMQRHSGAKNHLQERSHFLWETEWQLSNMKCNLLVFQMVLSRVREDHGKSLSPREAKLSTRKMRKIKRSHTGKRGEYNPWGSSPTDQCLVVKGEGKEGEAEAEAEEDVDNDLRHSNLILLRFCFLYFYGSVFHPSMVLWVEGAQASSHGCRAIPSLVRNMLLNIFRFLITFFLSSPPFLGASIKDKTSFCGTYLNSYNFVVQKPRIILSVNPRNVAFTLNFVLKYFHPSGLNSLPYV